MSPKVLIFALKSLALHPTKSIFLDKSQVWIHGCMLIICSISYPDPMLRPYNVLQTTSTNLGFFSAFRIYQPSGLLDYEWSTPYMLTPSPILSCHNLSVRSFIRHFENLAQHLTHHHCFRRSSLQLTFPSRSRSKTVSCSLLICIGPIKLHRATTILAIPLLGLV